MKNDQNQNTFSYEIKLNGVKAATDKDGTITFSDSSGKKLWYFQKPFMTDSNGKYSDKVTLTLRQEGGKTFVDVTADPSFLQDPATKYPVTIDPTIDPTIDSWNIMFDTFISAANPTTSYGSNAALYTGATTRNTQPATAATRESGVTGSSANAYWQWVITQLTKDWYNGVQPNYGFMLKQQNETTTPWRGFNSVSYGSNSPRLTINYTVDPIGTEDY